MGGEFLSHVHQTTYSLNEKDSQSFSVLELFELLWNCVKSLHWIWSWWLLMVFGDKSFVFQAGDCETFLLFLISCIDITFTDRFSLSAWAVMGVCTVWKRATDGSENASQLMWSCTQTPVVNTAHALSHKSVTTSETPGSCSWFWEEAPDLPRATVTVMCWTLFQVALCQKSVTISETIGSCS